MKRLKFLLLFSALILCLSQIKAQDFNQDWPILKTYSGVYLNEVAMPLGGIGTGTVSLGGRGDLRDWELMNRGALGYLPAFKFVPPTITNGPFFALYYRQEGSDAGIRVLEGPVPVKEYYGDWGSDAANSGFPRFEETIFSTAYPLAQFKFKHKNVPVQVRLEAFNPLVVIDAEKSGIPVAVLRYVITILTDKPIESAICGMVPNYIGVDGWGGEPKGNRNEFRSADGLNGVYMYVYAYESTVPFLFGDLSLKFREVEFLHATRDDGAIVSRVGLPLEIRAKKMTILRADGQMASIVRLYRDWQLSGNDAKLLEMGFNDHLNTFRSFVLGDEAGLIIISYPHGGLLDFPQPYYTEVMTGFEYSTGAHMIYEGQVEAGLKVYQSVRDRFDGYKRNPFNEGEYGHRYARAMAAWAGILAYTGFQYSAVEKGMNFNSRPGKYFWSNGYQYGTVEIRKQGDNSFVSLTCLSGELSLNSFAINDYGQIKFPKGKTFREGETIDFSITNN